MKKTLKIAIPVFLLIVLIAVASQTFYVVKENEYGCTVRFSKIIDTKSEPGLYFKVPFIDTVKTFPKTMLFYDIPPSEVLTLDKKSMTVDSYITWQIDDPLLFYQTVSTTTAAENRLYDTTYNAFKTKMGVLNQDDIINDLPAEERNVIYEEIKQEVMEKSKDYGISVVDVKMKRLDLPTENEEAVYTRMISERTRDAEQYRAEGKKQATQLRTDVDKQVGVSLSNARADAEKIIAEGEGEYMRILSEAFNTSEKQSFYEFVLSIEALEAAMKGESKTIILGKDSPITKVLLSDKIENTPDIPDTPVIPEQ
ncbi:MAG: protease modulator HflC [Clostridia bacterium]|nr:protease modulator HflC [Clostridia bacterium]